MRTAPLSLAIALLLAGAAGSAWSQKIFMCTDAKGNRLTSDRPIAECMDREQKELNPTGTVRTTIGPQLTAAERAAKEEEQRKLDQEKQRQSDEKRRERALLARYPNQQAHDLERTKALNSIQEVINAANKRTTDLHAQRKKLNEELEFFKGDAAKAPVKLKRQIDENEANIAGQARFLKNQEDEKGRVNKRFDDELAKLRVLWAEMKAAQVAPPPAAPAAPAVPQAKK